LIRMESRRYRFKRLETAQKGVSAESEIIDERFRFDIETKEFVRPFILGNRVLPVLSVPIRYNPNRKVFEVSEVGAEVLAYLRAYYYGATPPTETVPGDYPVALDAQHRLMVNADVVKDPPNLDIRLSVLGDKLSVIDADIKSRLPRYITDSSGNELSNYIKNLDAPLSSLGSSRLVKGGGKHTAASGFDYMFVETYALDQYTQASTTSTTETVLFTKKHPVLVATRNTAIGAYVVVYAKIGTWSASASATAYAYAYLQVVKISGSTETVLAENLITSKSVTGQTEGTATAKVGVTVSNATVAPGDRVEIRVKVTGKSSSSSDDAYVKLYHDPATAGNELIIYYALWS